MTISDLTSIGTPPSWGLPNKFTHFRPQQIEAVCSILDSPKRFIGIALPTGSGKSLVAVASHLIGQSKRTCILTSTKGLQEQYSRDFRSVGLVDVRGRNSYACNLGTNCEMGAFAKCFDRSGHNCPYTLAYQEFMNASIGITNYHYWIAQHRHGRGLGEFDVLILDEAHDVVSTLSDFVSVGVSAVRAHPKGDLWQEHKWWKRWAKAKLPVDKPDPKDEPEEYARLEKWEQTLKALSGMSDDWVIDKGEKFYNFSPLWPGREAEELLFRGVPKVVLMSGTIRPKTLELMGLSLSCEQYDFIEFDSPFDQARHPIYWIPTVRVDRRMTAEMEQLWLSRIDQILRTRTDRKGIIHAVSYKRAKYIMSQSDYRHMMMTHDSSSSAQVVEAFKRSAEPKILLSPSVTTGYDFPHDQCRYQILAKIPFPDHRETRNLAKARGESDPEYSNYGVMQQVVQACGRIMRDGDDWGETFIIDDHASWFFWKNQALMPKWFKVQKVSTIPRGEEIIRRFR